MIYVVAILLTAALLYACVRVVIRYWEWLLDTEGHRRDARLWAWMCKGVAMPVVMWLWFNFFLAPGHVAVMPDVIVAKLKTEDWAWVLCWLTLPTAIVAASFWAAMTLVWLVVHLVLQTDCRREILGASLWWGLWLSPVAAFILWVGGWWGMGFALVIVLIPIARDLLALGTPKKLPPAYARAIQRIKQGNYAAAEMEVVRQLEKRDDDFEGWMMLAGLYANHFGDLVEAERTVREVCRQTSLNRTEYCNALAQLAEWHLKIGKDRDAAHRIWMEICQKYPHSDFADMARRRIKSLHVTWDASQREADS